MKIIKFRGTTPNGKIVFGDLIICDVIIFGNDIEADNPINGNHYADAWHTIDRFGVKAT